MTKYKIIIFFVIVATVCVYLFSIKPIVVSSYAYFKGSVGNTLKFIDQENFNNYNAAIRLNRTFAGQRQFVTPFLDKEFSGIISAEPQSADSVFFSAVFRFPKTYNPFTQIKFYSQGVLLKKTFSQIIQSLYDEKKIIKTLYGLEIKHETIANELYLFLKKEFKKTPNMQQIKVLYDGLEQYIKKHQTKIVGTPMYNSTSADNLIVVKIAYPIEKTIPENNLYKIKRMVKGRVLHAEVWGGEKNIANAIKSVENYMQNNNLSAPAISFETFDKQNRFLTDTTHWHTHLYFPIY